MSTRYVATIQIPKKFIEANADVKEAIYDEFYWDGKVMNLDYYEDDGKIVKYGSDQTHGDFEDLENILEAAKIPYDRWCEGYDGDGSGEICYRPELGAVYVDGVEGERTFTESKLREITEGCATHEEIGAKFQAFFG